jgi:hypothetical protein
VRGNKHVRCSHKLAYSLVQSGRVYIYVCSNGYLLQFSMAIFSHVYLVHGNDNPLIHRGQHSYTHHRPRIRRWVRAYRSWTLHESPSDFSERRQRSAQLGCQLAVLFAIPFYPTSPAHSLPRRTRHPQGSLVESDFFQEA